MRDDVGTITQTDFGYTFQRNLPDTGLMDYRARFYDPYINRFIQPDTVIPSVANPQSLNRYSYVINNPIRYTDASGHSWDDCGDRSGYRCKIHMRKVGKLKADWEKLEPNIYGMNLAIPYANKLDGYLSTYAVAGIGVQNPFLARTGWRGTIAMIWGWAVTGGNTGLGIAKVTRNQIDADYGEEVYSGDDFRGYGLGMKGENPFDNHTAVQAMMRRIQIRTEHCDDKCTNTDLFLAAALGQNGPGFTTDNMDALMHGEDYKPRPKGTTHSLDWGSFISDSNKADTLRFHIAQFASNVEYLQGEGWDVPDDLDWNYIYGLTVTTVQP